MPGRFFFFSQKFTLWLVLNFMKKLINLWQAGKRELSAGKTCLKSNFEKPNHNVDFTNVIQLLGNRTFFLGR